MDAPVKKKALSRASLSPQRKDKRLVFPLVRYNEFRQPVCQACNVVMLDSIRAHLASPAHDEVMEKLKYKNAKPVTGMNNSPKANPVTGMNNSPKANPVTGMNNSPKANPEQPRDAECQLPEFSQDVAKHESPSALPRDFCDDSGKIRTRSVSKVTEMTDPPKEQEHQESKVTPSTNEALTSSKRGRPRKTKPTKFVINKKSNSQSTPRRSKRIKHVADKTANNVPEVSSSEELLKGRIAENSQVDGKEVSSDIDALVIYKRKRLPRRRTSGQISKSPKKTALTSPTAAISSSTTASPPHGDPPAAAPANFDAPHIENTNTAEPILSKSLIEEADKVNPAPANAQEQVASSKGQESPDQVDSKPDEVSTGNTPLDLEAINKMIEDDPLSAIENILSGKVSISSSKTPQPMTQSEQPKVQGSPADVLSKELKDLMQTFRLGDFVTDYEQMSKVLLILEELQKNEKFLSLEQQTFIKAFRLFFNNAITHRKECNRARAKKVELNRAKEDILHKLQEVKHTQEQITMSISNANNRVNEISSCIERLEEQLFKLKEERETFQLAIKDGEKQRETLKNDSILWAHQAKDLVVDLAEIEAKEKTLGQQLEEDNGAYHQFKASFPF